MDMAAPKSAWLFTVSALQGTCPSQIILPSTKDVGPSLTSAKPGSIYHCFRERRGMNLPESWVFHFLKLMEMSLLNSIRARMLV